MKITINLNLVYIDTKTLLDSLNKQCKYAFEDERAESKIASFKNILSEFHAITFDNPFYEVFIGYVLARIDKRISVNLGGYATYSRENDTVTIETENETYARRGFEMFKIVDSALRDNGIEYETPTQFPTESNPMADAAEKIEAIFNSAMKIEVGPERFSGYSDYSKELTEMDAVILDEDGLNLFVEWQAKDRAEAEDIAANLTRAVGNVLGAQAKFHAYRDIWNIESVDAKDGEEFWYVQIDYRIETPATAA